MTYFGTVYLFWAQSKLIRSLQGWRLTNLKYYLWHLTRSCKTRTAFVNWVILDKLLNLLTLLPPVKNRSIYELDPPGGRPRPPLAPGCIVYIPIHSLVSECPTILPTFLEIRTVGKAEYHLEKKGGLPFWFWFVSFVFCFALFPLAFRSSARSSEWNQTPSAPWAGPWLFPRPPEELLEPFPPRLQAGA